MSSVRRIASCSLGLALGSVLFSFLGCKGPGTASPDPSASASATIASNGAPSAAPFTPKPGDLPAPPDVAGPAPDLARTPSGLASKVITPGTGTDHPAATDKVKVDYTGWTKDGHMFDSSVVRGQPATFPLNGVIKGWTEGVQLMVVGETRRFWIPAALAYGNSTRGGAPSGDLTFDVKLLEIVAAPKPPPVPEDVKAAPASAKKTASGLQYRVLTPGTGTDHPGATSRVVVNYSGWTPDGKMFDSSITRGEPARFALNQVVPGWGEGVQLMTTGEKARFWIPSALAYGDKPTRPGAPTGPLVFDIELISFEAPRAMPSAHPH